MWFKTNNNKKNNATKQGVKRDSTNSNRLKKNPLQ